MGVRIVRPSPTLTFTLRIACLNFAASAFARQSRPISRASPAFACAKSSAFLRPFQSEGILPKSGVPANFQPRVCPPVKSWWRITQHRQRRASDAAKGNSRRARAIDTLDFDSSLDDHQHPQAEWVQPSHTAAYSTHTHCSSHPARNRQLTKVGREQQRGRRRRDRTGHRGQGHQR